MRSNHEIRIGFDPDSIGGQQRLRVRGRDYGYVAEYSRTLGAHTAVATDSDDELPPHCQARLGPPPMQVFRFWMRQVATSAGTLEVRDLRDWIRKFWRSDCGSLVDRRRREGQELGEGEREVLAFLPPALHVVDGWRSRGLATGDSIISLARRSRVRQRNREQVAVRDSR